MQYQTTIQKIKDKDPDCLEALYNQYGRKLYSYCLRQWNLEEDTAWEAVYKTLEAIITKGGYYDFESEIHFNNFLFKVLLNFIRQQYRKSQAAKVDLQFVDLYADEALPAHLQKYFNEQAHIDYYEAEHPVENALLYSFTEALLKLNTVERDLLLLKAQNYTYDEIATMLGIENNQLKVKHHRAKQKLIQLLKDIPHHENA